MNLEVIIGLEIHAQISSQTKMFCSCDNDAFGKAPNTTICPVCTGHPGTLPVPNQVAVEKGVQAALALGCTIPAHAKFDRKNYFYPDLPAGYQISQFDEPVSVQGSVEIQISGQPKKIGVTRLHLENDAGKLTHVGQFSLCDYNRAGTPLMEIVSEPDLRSAEEARLYAEEVARIVQYVGSSNADMYKGELRFDASVSLRPVGEDQLYPRAEIKNLNSFKALEAAINYEIKRQTKLWEADKVPDKETTIGWNDEKGETYLMREKESAADYRYFPEPDIPPLTFDPAQIKKWQKELPELPLARRQRFVQDYKVSEQDATTLTDSKDLADWYEEVAKKSGNPKKAASWVLTETLGRMKLMSVQSGEDLEFLDGEKMEYLEAGSVSDLKFSASQLGELVKMIEEGSVSGKQAKEILDFMFEGSEGGDPTKIAKAKGMEQVSDSGAIEKFVDQVLQENEKVVVDFKAGKGNALGFLVGQVIKVSKGQANPKLVNELLNKKLG